MRIFNSLTPAVLTLAFAFGTGGAERVSAQGAEPAVINLINLPNAASGEVYFAQDMGFFKAAGLQVHITASTSTPGIIAAIISGAADIGFGTPAAVAAARERKVPVRFIAPGAMYVRSNPTSQLVGAEDTTIATASDLNGKTVAVTSLGELSYYATKAWMEQNGGDASSVKFVEIPYSLMAGALAQHRVDAATLTEPFLTVAKSEVRPIADVNTALPAPFLLTGWISSERWIRDHPIAAARFAAVMRRTAEWANTHREESMEILLRYLHISPQVAATMVTSKYALALDTKLLAPQIDVVAKYESSRQSGVSPNELMWEPAK